jgi:hypothetical protein
LVKKQVLLIALNSLVDNMWVTTRVEIQYYYLLEGRYFRRVQ